MMQHIHMLLNDFIILYDNLDELQSVKCGPKIY